MKRLILFSMVCLMTTVTQAQNEITAVNDSVVGNIKEGEKLQEITVRGSRVVQPSIPLANNWKVVPTDIRCYQNSRYHICVLTP